MRKSIYAGAAVFLLMLVGGCNNMTGPESGHIADQDGKAAVSIAIAGTGIQGRSVLPNGALDDVTVWQLWGGKTADPKDLLKEFSDPADQTLYLETGTWDFTLEGYKGTSLVLRGNITNKSISFEGSNTLSFIAVPILEGNGTVKITINLPSGHGITQAKVFKDGLDIDSPITPSGDLIVFEVPYAADDYYFSFHLYKGMDLYGVISELIKVRMNLSSEKTFTLDREDLNIRYVITYHLNNGQLGDGAQNPDYYRHTDAALTLSTPTWTGYTFGGWYETSAFTGSAVTSIPAGSMGNKTFYAQWTATPYTISYELNGGTNATENPAAYTVESPAITLAAPNRANYTFGGWYSDAGFTTAVTGIPAGSTNNKTFYAKWNPGASVQITLQPHPDDPTLSNVSIFVDDQAQFSAAETGYASWQWRWNGMPISGAHSDTYTLAANSKPAGVYELSVEVITDGGQTLSARCRVTIKAK
jgi:uncharacterized repeat protein (TIGR02543 family)